MRHPRGSQPLWHALGDPTRRTIVERLAGGDRTVMELAAMFDMTQPAVTKHLNVLERAGIIRRTKAGRTRRCSLRPESLESSLQWLQRVRSLWNDRLDGLLALLSQTPPRKAPHATSPDA